jgi:hypothetical protein
MKTLNNTIENNAKVEALKKVANTDWSGTTIHDNINKCLIAMSLFSGVNSGHYNPSAISIEGLEGLFMINQDGSIFCESRIIQENENKFRIEHMSNKSWYQFENDYSNFLD